MYKDKIMAIIISVVLAIAMSLSSARIQTINVDLNEGSIHEIIVVYCILQIYPKLNNNLQYIISLLNYSYILEN